MSSTSRLDWQTTTILALAILIFGGGTMVLLVMRIDVPGALWAIVGGVANAIVANGAFFTQRQMQAAALWHMAQTVPTGSAATISVTPAGTTPTGERSSA